MKCDQLKEIFILDGHYTGEGIRPVFVNCLAYGKEEVDEAIAELKRKLHDAEMKADLAEWANTEYRNQHTHTRCMREAVMKCDHIRTRAQGDMPFFPNMLNNGKVEVCLKEDVDAAIAELKTENERLKNWPHTDNSTVIYNLSEELCATRRSLWLSRADRARCTWKYYAEFLVFPREAEMKRWKKVEQLCRAKAEEYK